MFEIAKENIVAAFIAVGLLLTSSCGATVPEYLQIGASDISMSVYEIEGKGYVGLNSFASYLNPSKNRYTPTVDLNNETINFSSFSYYNPDLVPQIDPETEFDNLVKVDMTLINDNTGKRKKAEVLNSSNEIYIRLDDAKEILDFNTKLEGEGARVIFKDEDTKKLYSANNREYDWYMDQGHTGTYRDGNCGPTSVSMAMKWLDKNSKATGENAREEYLMDGGWWSTSTIESYLTSHNANYEALPYVNPEVITDAVDRGSVVIVCINMALIPQNKEPGKSNKDRFYNFAGGHFLVIKGYKIENGRLYYEVYDPNNWDMKYQDTGEELGKDRLYSAYDMDAAIRNWWLTVYEIKDV